MAKPETGKTTSRKCSLCGKVFDASHSRTVPFCSTRCQQIDLGNWLNEDYGLPVESGPESEEMEMEEYRRR